MTRAHPSCRSHETRNSPCPRKMKGSAKLTHEKTTRRSGMSAPRLRYSAVVSALVFVSFYAHGQTETVLYKFTGTRDGVNSSPSIVAMEGNLYGITQVGGLGYGTVYALSPNGSGGWKENTLRTFTLAGADGYDPQSLTSDGKENLFGTTNLGGANGRG